MSERKLSFETLQVHAVTLKKLGIKVVFVDPDDPENFRKAITDKTKAQENLSFYNLLFYFFFHN